MLSTGIRFGLCLLAGVTLPISVALAGMGLPERLNLLAERIEAAPTDPALYLRRALIYGDMGEFKLAFADIETAAEYGSDENAAFARGILLYRLGQYDQAVRQLDRFLEAHPQHTAALLYRARVLRDADEPARALADYRQYLRLHPKPEPGEFLSAARLMVQLADRGDSGVTRADALEFLDASMGPNRYAPQLQRYAIEIEQQACRAEQVLGRLKALHPNARRAPRWHLSVAEQHLLLAQPEPAAQALDAAKELLSERRPTAANAAQSHRHDFLRAWMKLRHASPSERDDRLAALYHRYYPDTAQQSTDSSQSHHHRPAEHSHPALDPSQRDHAEHDHVHASDHDDAHGHSALVRFQQPSATPTRYAPEWSEPVAPFYRCAKLAARASR